MEKNDIYELSHLLSNQDGLGKDFAQLMLSFQETLQQKYIKRLHATAKERQNAVIEHPSKEVTLLRAMQAFTNDSGKQQMDNMIQSLLFLQAMQNINKDVTSLLENRESTLQAMGADNAQAPATFPSDENARMTGLLVTLALANMI